MCLGFKNTFSKGILLEKSIMEESKETTVPVSETSDQDTQERVNEPVTKKTKRVLTDKQKAILTLGREKARANRENKTKAKLDGMLEDYLKQKSEESKSKSTKKQKLAPATPPPPLSPSSDEVLSSSEEDFSSDESSDFTEPPPPPPTLSRSKNYTAPRRQTVSLSFK